jgi:hypothetical protein
VVPVVAEKRMSNPPSRICSERRGCWCLYSPRRCVVIVMSLRCRRHVVVVALSSSCHCCCVVVVIVASLRRRLRHRCVVVALLCHPAVGVLFVPVVSSLSSMRT